MSGPGAAVPVGGCLGPLAGPKGPRAPKGPGTPPQVHQPEYLWGRAHHTPLSRPAPPKGPGISHPGPFRGGRELVTPAPLREGRELVTPAPLREGRELVGGTPGLPSHTLLDTGPFEAGARGHPHRYFEGALLKVPVGMAL